MAADATQITLLQLKQYGIENVDHTETFANFTADTLYSVISQAMRKAVAIFDEDVVAKLPAKLPAAASSRFNLCGKMVTQLNNAGLNAEFNALMYPTEESSRTVITWIVSKLAAASEEETRGVTAQSASAASSMPQSSFQRGLNKLRLKVSDAQGRGAIVSKKVKESATEGVYLPSARRADPTPEPSLLLLPFRNATIIPNQVSIDTINAEHEVVMKQPVLPKGGRGPRTPYALYLQDSINEVSAVMRTQEAGFDELCDAQRLTSDEASKSAKAAAKKRQAKKKVTATPKDDEGTPFSVLATEAMFYNSDNTVTVQELKQAEEAAEAAVKNLEDEHASAEKQLQQREEEAKNIKNQLKDAKRAVASQQKKLTEMQRELQEIEEEKIAEHERVEMENVKLLEIAATLQDREEKLAVMNDPDAARSQLQLELDALNQKRAAAKDELAGKLAKVEAKREALLEETAGTGTGRQEQVATLRKDCKATKRLIKERNTEITKLQHQLDACPKDIDRGNFLRLIFDLTSNIRKQQEQIDKMKREICEADTEIDKLHDKIKSVFDAVEQEAFDSATGAGSSKDTKKKSKKDDGSDVFGKDLFKKFFDLRKAYNDLIAVIESRGGVRKEIHETEQQASKLHLIVSGYKMDGVEQDLQLIQDENEQLQTAIDAANPE